MANKVTSPSERFWKKVEITTINSCWKWLGGKYYNGYGQFFDGERKIGAHRFAYKDTFGKFDNYLLVCHTCDNRECVNPSHLFLGTQKENLRDMIKKGRQVSPDRKGGKNGRSVVNEKIVKEMRRIYSEGNISYIELGKKFGVSETQTHRIIKRESWRHI